MFPAVLERFTSDEFQVPLDFISTPNALYRALKRCEAVADVQRALASGELMDSTVREFVRCLLGDLKPGEPFIHDLALAAIGVAIESRMTQFADEFLTELAQLSIVEMPKSTRVARECVKRRQSVATSVDTLVIQDIAAPQCVSLSYEELGNYYPHRHTSQVAVPG